ncbi:hypothetical protein BKN37_07280 [Mycobacterium talmoniae]|uniref:Uncharacterized protein n=1 Tax=Mycobacterium talmoniae TaxID=1858794 RepID=A0A1S1NQG6_9MYCO|nr:hypothetical protein BKN37_07280 [Mycobacterium talmoniae]
MDLVAEEAAAVLVEAGADVNRRDRWGNTPLWRAVYHLPRTDAIAALLLDHGADPTAKNNHDISPLDLARRMAASGHDGVSFSWMATGMPVSNQ